MNRDVNRPDCDFVDTWLDDWLAGRLPDEAARRIDAHLAACERCRRLTAIVSEAADENADAPADDAIVSAVLQQTVGSPCARAEALLLALVDGEIDRDSGEVLRSHLAHCDACSKLFAVLQEERDVLPALAEIQPPLGFVQRVLAVTTGAPPAPSLFWRLLARPRASLELAYVATILLVVLFGNPVGAFYSAEQHASELAAAAPVARLSQQLGVGDAAASTIGRAISGVASVLNQLQSAFVARWIQARSLLDAIETRAANAITWLASLDVKQWLHGAAPPAPRGQPAGNGGEPSGRR